MRQEHRAGEKTFVDYAGQTVTVTDPSSGEVRQAQVFVAVLGASNYTYAEATWTQNLWDWIHAHVRAFEFFDGTSLLVVPDNLKSGSAGINRHIVGDARAPQERRSDSILASSLACDLARDHSEA